MRRLMLGARRLCGRWPAGPGRLGAVAIAIVLAVSLSPCVEGAELEVRQAGGADHTSVQAAIDAANPGDTITILDSATYVEDVSFGVLHPSLLNSKANITLQSADGERPLIQASNTADRFDLGAPDFSGVLVLSQGVTLKGLNILNSGDATGSALGVGIVMSIHASDVSVIDCDLSQEGGVVGSQGSTLVSVSDFTRLAGGPDTVDNVYFSDCTLHDGTGLGMSVFPFSFQVNPGIVDSVHHVTLERCVIRNCARQGFETDGLGSVTLTDVVCHGNGGSGIELGIQQATLTDCESSDNGSAGVSVEYPDVVEGGAMMVTATGLTCINNGAGGLNVAEGTVVITNLVLADNMDYNLEVYPLKHDPWLPDVTLAVDHATLYYLPRDPAELPNILIDALGADANAALTLKNAILMGPAGIDNRFQDVTEPNLVVTNSMFWNDGDAVIQVGTFTEVDPVAPVDPLLVDPVNRDFRLTAGSPVAAASDLGGPLGGAGIVVELPTSIAVELSGISNGQFFLEWQGATARIFDIHGGASVSNATWPVIDSVTGTEGTQRWDDPRPTQDSQFYRVEGRSP